MRKTSTSNRIRTVFSMITYVIYIHIMFDLRPAIICVDLGLGHWALETRPSFSHGIFVDITKAIFNSH